jgi:hypothetical protein
MPDSDGSAMSLCAPRDEGNRSDLITREPHECAEVVERAASVVSSFARVSVRPLFQMMRSCRGRMVSSSSCAGNVRPRKITWPETRREATHSHPWRAHACEHARHLLHRHLPTPCALLHVLAVCRSAARRLTWLLLSVVWCRGVRSTRRYVSLCFHLHRVAFVRVRDWCVWYCDDHCERPLRVDSKRCTCERGRRFNANHDRRPRIGHHNLVRTYKINIFVIYVPTMFLDANVCS